MNICCLNVVWFLNYKIQIFLKFMETYDILVFQETKIDQREHLNLPNGYSYQAKHREKCTRKSGGIIIICKCQIETFLVFPESNSSFVQWLRITNDFLNIPENLVIGYVYVTPPPSPLPREYNILIPRCIWWTWIWNVANCKRGWIYWVLRRL